MLVYQRVIVGVGSLFFLFCSNTSAPANRRPTSAVARWFLKPQTAHQTSTLSLRSLASWQSVSLRELRSPKLGKNEENLQGTVCNFHGLEKKTHGHNWSSHYINVVVFRCELHQIQKTTVPVAFNAWNINQVEHILTKTYQPTAGWLAFDLRLSRSFRGPIISGRRYIKR